MLGFVWWAERDGKGTGGEEVLREEVDEDEERESAEEEVRGEGGVGAIGVVWRACRRLLERSSRSKRLADPNW